MMARIRMMGLLSIALMTAAAAAGCTAPAAPDTQDASLLTSSPWQATRVVNTRGELASVWRPKLAGYRTPDISFSKAGVASGNAGVNTFTGPYAAEEDGSISLGPFAVTKMAGPVQAQRQEDAYLQALGRAERYEVDAETLVLFDAAGKPLIEYEAGTAVTLENVTWMLTGYNNGMEAIVSVVPSAPVTALFEDGSLSGSSGVNQYGTSYELDGSRLTIDEQINSTLMAGPADAMDQESAYLALLPKVRSYTIAGEELTLLGEDRTRLLIYRLGRR